MNRALLFILCFFGSLTANERPLLIVTNTPKDYIQVIEARKAPVHLVVPTNALAQGIRKARLKHPQLTIYTQPLFCYTGVCEVYFTGPSPQDVTLLPPRKKARSITKKCLSLDTFIARACISSGTDVLIDWGATGYFVARYADLSIFHTVCVKHLPETLEDRLKQYYDTLSKEEV